MALPILSTPEYSATIPSTGQSIMFRPFLVKEEKILFMALQGKDEKEIAKAVSNILAACILTEDVDVTKLAIFDVEYLFLQLRGKSVGENVDLKLKHRSGDCKHVEEVSVLLDQIKVKFPEGYTNKFQLTPDVGMQMQFPGIDHLGKMNYNNQTFDELIGFIADCVNCIYDHDNVYEEFTKEEIVAFLESLSQSQFTNIQQFFTDPPKLEHDIEWTCPECGVTEMIHLEGLASFFT